MRLWLAIIARYYSVFPKRCVRLLCGDRPLMYPSRWCPCNGYRSIFAAGYGSKQRLLCVQKGNVPDRGTLPNPILHRQSDVVCRTRFSATSAATVLLICAMPQFTDSRMVEKA